jgi:hypothetical protein
MEETIMPKFINKQFNVIEEVRVNIYAADDHDFDVHEWCEYDARILEGAAKRIRRELIELDKKG